ncbi:MAG: VWA domain-containing protein [Myxococcota bacterium]
MTRSTPLLRFLGALFAPIALGGCDVSFSSPIRLWALLLVPALVGAAQLIAWRRRVLLERFVGSAAPKLLSHSAPWRRAIRLTLLCVSLTALILAWSGFRWGYRWETVYRRGVDLMIVLDVSRSMDARDADGSGRLSRLVRARREIIDLLGKLQGDRVGLVVFAGTAINRCPLTNDYKTVELLLENVDSDMISLQGTDIGRAISVALEGFKRGPGRSQAMILLTDGEDHMGDVSAATQAAQEKGVRIYAIGIGKETGAPVPGASGGFHTDRAGKVVMSRLEESALEALALETGGRYVRSVTGDVDLEEIYLEGIRKTVESRDMDSNREKRWNDRFQWLLAVALLALALEPLIGIGARR